MSDPLNERLNKILPRVISDDFLSGSGIGNEIAFYIFDYPPEDELRVRDYLRTLLDHIPKQKHGLRVKHIDLFDFVMDYLKSRKLLDKAGVRHDMVIRTGHIAAEIAAAASEGGFDLLVLGSKGRSSLKDLLIGSVAQRVSELSKVPVLLVK